MLYQIANAQMREYPYAHLCVDEVFPEAFYRQMRENWPLTSSLVSLADTGRVSKGSYPERFILPFTPEDVRKLDDRRQEFWLGFGSWLFDDRFMLAIIAKFEPYIRARFGAGVVRNRYDAKGLIVRDTTNYAIGPHTDAPHRLLSMLFYCPDDDSRAHLGTSIYVPNDPAFRCAGGPHYRHELFRKVKTMEYRRNSLFAFIKNDFSFHGVDPIGEQAVGRDVLLYDIRVHQTAAETVPAATSATGATFLARLFGNRKQ